MARSNFHQLRDAALTNKVVAESHRLVNIIPLF